MDTKMLNQAKSKVKDNIKITKETDQKIYFEVNSFKGSYNKSMKPQAPQWFQNFETKNDLRWEEQIKFNAKQERFNSEIKSSIQGINTRIDNLVTKNNLSE